MTFAVPAEVPASRKDQAQWMLHRLVPGRGVCNVGVAVRVERRLRWWPLQEALDHLASRHPALRATLRTDGRALYKRYRPLDEITVPLDTLAGTEEGLADQITELIGIPFDIEGGVLFRAHLIMVPTGSVVCLVLHHIVGDGVTGSVLWHELVALYDAFAANGKAPAGLDQPAPLHHEPPPHESTVEYWRAHLAGVDPARLALAAARPLSARPTFAGSWVDRTLGPRSRAAVGRLRDRTRTTENIVLLAAYYLLLAKHGAGPDLVVGVLTNGRRGGVAPDVVGYHANTLPVRVNIDQAADFATLARTTRDAFLVGLDHGDISFEAVQHVLDSRAEDWRVPLFRHAFNHMPPSRTRDGEVTMAGAPVTSLNAFHAMSRVDLELILWTYPDSLVLVARYSTEVHDRAYVSALLARLEQLLEALDAGYGSPVGAVDCGTESEVDIVWRVNETTRAWPPETVAGLVDVQARRRPDAPAIDGWSYGRLLATRTRIVDELRRAGVRRGDNVGLFAGRAPGLAAAALAVWHVGAAYVPLDPAHPAERNAGQLADAGVRVVLTDRPLPASCAAGRTAVDLAACAGDAAKSAGTTGTDVGIGSPSDPAYVIYTSGSTGRPKGVTVSHANLANVVHHFTELLGVTEVTGALWSTTFSFDISALELFLPLAAGGRVTSVDDQLRADAGGLLDRVVEQDLTVLQATPTLWRHLAGDLRGRLRGRRILCGGEPLTTALAERLLADGCRLFNVYGPTETTIWSTAAELHAPVGDPPPIGRPISNTRVYVTDTDGWPVPLGVPGELRIGGEGVAIGYHGDPDSTAERFPHDAAHGRRYRTGDRVRQRPDGSLEYLGRTDRQVKVRGHRIEPGEVEALLEAHSEVRAAAVFAEPDPAGQVRLVAAIEPAAAANGLLDRIRDHAASRLPAAMTPGRFALVARMPLTGNGKVDYRELKRLGADVPAPASPLPADPTVRSLTLLWRDVLADERLGADAHFFASGGHSLLAIQLADRVRTTLGAAIEFDAIFETPTPALLAARLANGGS